MLVSSDFELYGVYLGWQQYDCVWQVCVQFGLAYIPFLALFLKQLTEPFIKGSGFSDGSLRTTMMQFIIMILMVFLCVQPWHSLSAQEIKYQPQCVGMQSAEGKVTPSTVGHTGTTYDQVFASVLSDDIKIPLIPGLITDWASGLTNTLIRNTTSCQYNLNPYMHILALDNFTPALANEISRFNHECYATAKASYDSHQDSDQAKKATSTAANYGGTSDLGWIGSQGLLTAYYPKIYAQSPVEGFPYAAYKSPTAKDTLKQAIDSGSMAAPVFGYPTCDVWWSDKNNGLRAKIIASIQQKLQETTNEYSPVPEMNEDLANWKAKAHPNSKNQITMADSMVKAELTIRGTDSLNTVNTGNTGLWSKITEFFTDSGTLIKEGTSTAYNKNKVANMLPIIQGLCIYILLVIMPIVFVLGNYDVGIIFTVLVLFASLIFMNYLWSILNYMQNVYEASLPDMSIIAKGTLDNIMPYMYFFVILLFLGLVNLTGYKVGGAIRAIMPAAMGAAIGSDGLGMPGVGGGSGSSEGGGATAAEAAEVVAV